MECKNSMTLIYSMTRSDKVKSPPSPKSLRLPPLVLALLRVCAYLDKEPYYDGRFNACDPG
jgi:hypothetical protein